MSAIQSTTGSQNVGQLVNNLVGTTSGGRSSATDQIGADGTEDRFLKLLVAQMRNQDPLNPMDNAQVTTQMAQISTVRGIETLNNSMASMVSGVNKGSMLDALGLIGRNVLAAGNTFTRQSGTDGATRGGFVLPAAADQVQVQIVDAAGQPVFTRSYGTTVAGTHQFAWDGTTAQGTAAPAGNYMIRVAASAGGKNLPVTTLAPSAVLGVSSGADGVVLELSGQRTLTTDSIKAIF